MSCYVSQQLICLGISSVFCNLHCRTLLCICTKLFFFFTLIRKVCSNQSPAETWMELQGSAAVPGVGAVFAALPLYRLCHHRLVTLTLCVTSGARKSPTHPGTGDIQDPGVCHPRQRFSPRVSPHHICTNNGITHSVHGNILF